MLQVFGLFQGYQDFSVDLVRDGVIRFKPLCIRYRLAGFDEGLFRVEDG
jgi:hypothetical protein